MNKEKFIEEVKKLGIELDLEKQNLLKVYYEELLMYNKHTNLTAITEEKDVYLKHFYDSLTITKCIDITKENSLLDIGSGAGFPGLVLKIVFPHLKVTLIDSNNKKTKFLLYMIEKLQLKNIEVINDRVENFSKINLNSYDIVTARAVTNLPVLTELAMPLVQVGKYFIPMKANIDEEISKSMYAIEKMKGKLESIVEFEMFDAGKRSIIKIQKKEKTLQEELRSYDKIKKKPLQNNIK